MWPGKLLRQLYRTCFTAYFPTNPRPTSQPPTSAPTPTPDPVRDAEVVNFINNITLSNQTLQYPAVGTPSPEEEALAWLIEDDPAHLSVSMGAERIRQRYALLTLWFRQPTSTQTKLADWLSIDECNWEGPAPCTTRPVWWLPLICVAAISRVAFRMTLVS